MFRIYLDKQIFSYLFNPRGNEKHIALREKIYQYKDDFVFYFSEAHMMDLSKDMSEIKYQELDFMETIVGRNGLRFYNNRPTFYSITPREGFEELMSIEPFDFGKLDLDNLTDDQILSMANSMDVVTKSLNGELPPKWIENREPIRSVGVAREILSNQQLIAQMDTFMQRYSDEYKWLRDLMIQEVNPQKTLDIDSGNIEYTNWSFSEFLPKLLSQFGLEKRSDLQSYLYIYLTLDMFGINPEKRGSVRFENMEVDARHSYFATTCDCFVVNDKGLAEKAKKLYKRFGVSTKVIGIDEFITSLDKMVASSQMAPGEIVHSLIDFINNSEVVSESHVENCDLTLYGELSTPYLGYFNEPMLFKSNGDIYLILRNRSEYGSVFISFEEIKLVTNKIIRILPLENKTNQYFDREAEYKELRQGRWGGRNYLSSDVDFRLFVDSEYILTLCIKIKDEVLLSKIASLQ